jgi:hypothetical protein
MLLMFVLLAILVPLSLSLSPLHILFNSQPNRRSSHAKNFIAVAASAYAITYKNENDFNKI